MTEPVTLNSGVVVQVPDWGRLAPPPASAPESFAGRPTRLVRASTWVPRPVPTLIDGLMHRQGLAQIAAKPGVGKSPIAADLAVAVANADRNGCSEWVGRTINRRGPVLYVALEGAEIVHGYIAESCAARGHGTDGANDVWVIEEPELNLASGDGALDSLERVGHDLDAAGVEPVLAIFDTQVDMLGGVDDYKATAVVPLIDKLRRWCVSRDLLGVLLHHTTHQTDRGSGSINIQGKVDVAAVLVKSKDEVVTLSVDKRKGLGKPTSVATCTFYSGPVAGNAAVRWVKTGADAAELPAAGEAAGDAGRDARTKEWLLRLMPALGATKVDGRGKEKDHAWNNAEAVKSMQALAERPGDEGGPVDVHTDKRYVGPLLDELAGTSAVVDLVQQWKTGMSHQWQADRRAVTPPDAGEAVQ